MRALSFRVPLVLGLCWPVSFALGQAVDPLAQWGQWRGPLATGAAPKAKPPVEWSEAKNIRWKTELPGLGHSSPVVWGGLVFLTTAERTGAKKPFAGVTPDGALSYGDKIGSANNRMSLSSYGGSAGSFGGAPGNRDDQDLTSGDRADIIVGLVNEISSHMLAMKTGELKEFKDLLQPMMDEISDHAHEIAASEVDI